MSDCPVVCQPNAFDTRLEVTRPRCRLVQIGQNLKNPFLLASRNRLFLPFPLSFSPSSHTSFLTRYQKSKKLLFHFLVSAGAAVDENTPGREKSVRIYFTTRRYLVFSTTLDKMHGKDIQAAESSRGLSNSNVTSTPMNFGTNAFQMKKKKHASIG